MDGLVQCSALNLCCIPYTSVCACVLRLSLHAQHTYIPVSSILKHVLCTATTSAHSIPTYRSKVEQEPSQLDRLTLLQPSKSNYCLVISMPDLTGHSNLILGNCATCCNHSGYRWATTTTDSHVHKHVCVEASGQCTTRVLYLYSTIEAQVMTGTTYCSIVGSVYEEISSLVHRLPQHF